MLPSLVPLKRWKTAQRNVKVKDVAMMLYQGNLRNDYSWVTTVFPDSKGHVRSVKVAFRKKDKCDDKSSYKRKPLIEEIVSVQRLSLIVPFEEASENEK